MTVRVGVIGCGHWGPNLVRNFASLPGSALAGICDRDEQRLALMRTLYPSVPCLDDLDAFLALPGLDAVAIATPLHTHFPLAMRALSAGKHVLIEKPLAAATEECLRLIAAAQAAGKVLCVGHVFLYNSAVRYVKAFLDRGDAGELYYLYFTRTNLGPVREDTNAMWDLASHDISIALYWMNAMPVRARASGYTYLQHKQEDVVFAELEFPSGAVAHLHTSWLDPCKVRRATVIASQKMLVYSDVDTVAPVTIYDKRIDPPPFTDTMAEFHMSIRDGDILIPRLSLGEPLKAECQHFIDCAANQTRPLTDGENGLAVVRILERLQESMRAGGAVVNV